MGYAPFRLETRAGKSIRAGTRWITPFSQALIFQIPGLPGGLIWNRPVSVLVHEPNGEERVLPVVDRTRQIELALLGAAAGFSLVLLRGFILNRSKTFGGKK